MTLAVLDTLGSLKTDYPAVVAAILLMPPADAVALIARHLPAAVGPQASDLDPREAFALAIGTAAGLNDVDCCLAVTLPPADEDRWDAFCAALALP